MKKIWDVLVLTLAVNFLLTLGTAGWLVGTHRLDKKKFVEMKKLLLLTAAGAATQPSTQPTADADATTRPSIRLDALLARASGRTAVDQVEYIRQNFDEQGAQLDRRARELSDLQQQVEIAKQQVLRDRAQLQQDQLALKTREDQDNKDATDKGFQDALELYNNMPPRQVKGVFMGLSDDVVTRYLQAMEPTRASKILKEFKTPEESDRLQKILEKIRLSGPAPTAGTALASP